MEYYGCSYGMILFEELAGAFVAVLAVSVFLLLRLRNRSRSIGGVSDRGKLPPGSCGMPIVGETIMYMSSMKTSKPTFMAERRQRQVHF
jgi:hypothetical protein